MIEGQTFSTADVSAALAWLVMAGVDTAVDPTPRRWLDAPPAPRPELPAQRPELPIARPATPRPVARPAPFPAGVALPAAAITAATLAELAVAVAGFDHPLRRGNAPPRLLTGNPEARVIILCDQPEDEAAPAALLRARMLAAVGLGPGNCAVLNRIPWPMPGGRSPSSAEVTAFAPFADRALALVRPRAVLALGQLAAGLAGEAMARASARGRWADLVVGDGAMPMLATCHPRLLLTQPLRKREAWADLQAFAARLAETA